MKYLNYAVKKKIKIISSLFFVLFISISFVSCNGLDITKIPGDDGGGGVVPPIVPPTTPTGRFSLTDSLPILSIKPVIGLEGESVTFEIRLSKPAVTPITVSYETQYGRVSGRSKLQKLSKAQRFVSQKVTDQGDYTAILSTDYTFAIGEYSKTVSIQLLRDSQTEGTEAFVLEVRPKSMVDVKKLAGASLVIPFKGIAYIIDEQLASATSKVYFPASVSIAEYQGSVKIPFVIVPPLRASATLSYSTAPSELTKIAIAGDTANNGDYIAKSGETVLRAGDSAGFISIDINDDNIDENDEDFLLNVSSLNIELDQEAAGSLNIASNSIVVPVIIKDDEQKPYFIINTNTIAESNTAVVAATVSLSWPSETSPSLEYKTLAFAPTATKKAATVGADYVAITTKTLTFLPNSIAPKNIRVSLNTDKEQEGNEIFYLFFTNVDTTKAVLRQADMTVASTLKKEVTIRDSFSAPQVNLVASNTTVNESDTPKKFFVSLNKTSSVPQTITYTLAGVGSNPATTDDYEDQSGGSITIPANKTTASLSIIFSSTTDTSDEQLLLTLTDATGGATLGVQNTTTITIANTAKPTVQVTPTLSLVEGTNGNITFTLSELVVNPVLISYIVIAETASSSDYNTRDGRVTISNSLSKTLSISTKSDLLDEDNETFKVVITSVTEAVIDRANFLSTITITDNDETPTVQFVDATSIKTETAGNILIPLELSATSDKDITLKYTLTGGATINKDYWDLGEGRLYIPAGATKANIKLQLLGDVIYDPNEDIVVILSSPTNASLGTNTRHDVAIEENLSIPTVSFASQSIVVTESSSAKVFKIPVTLDKASKKAVVVNYSLSSDTATAGADYADGSTAGSVTISSGEIREYILISITGDAIKELTEQFTVNLIPTTQDAIIGVRKKITVTVHDDDGLPELSFASGGGDVIAEGAVLNISVALDVPAKQDIRLFYSVSGTGTNAASSTDYRISSPNPMVIVAGETSSLITVVAQADAISELTEEATLTLHSISYGTINTIKTKKFTITDQTIKPTISVAATRTCREDIAVCSIPVSLNRVSGNSVTVNYSLTTGTGAGAANTGAVANPDYADGGTGSVTISPGQLTANILVTMTDDDVYEANEIFTVTLTDPVNANLDGVSGTPTNHMTTVTITEDDSKPTVTIPPVTTCAYTAGTATNCLVTLTLSRATALPVRVDGTATRVLGSVRMDITYSETTIAVLVPVSSTADAGRTYTTSLTVSGAGVLTRTRSIEIVTQ